MRNDNETERFGVSQATLDRLFERTGQDLMNARDARQRAEVWPHQIEQVLAACVKRIVNLEAVVAELKASKP